MRAVLIADAEEKDMGSLAGYLCFQPWQRYYPVSLSLTSVWDEWEKQRMFHHQEVIMIYCANFA